MRYLGIFLAILRHYVNDDVIAALKKAAIEAVTHGEWSQGEKTAFVIDSVRDVVAATPTPIDDFLVEIGARLYLRKYGS